VSPNYEGSKPQGECIEVTDMISPVLIVVLLSSQYSCFTFREEIRIYHCNTHIIKAHLRK